MSTQTSSQHTPAVRFEDLNWIAKAPLLRDRGQSHRLHEPGYLIGTIDPITGRDVGDLFDSPSLVDGNLTIYFESEETKAEFERSPVNHPYERPLGEASAEMDRGG